MDNIIELRRDLLDNNYKHADYQAFNIDDPKPRIIHKAIVRDRLLHHAVHRILYPFFSKTFITDSYSCQLRKGTFKSINQLRTFGNIVSKNNTRTCWILKCDIRKFFANIDHGILMNILEKYISEEKLLWLLKDVVESFESRPSVGLPLGNLTSQLLVNIYMNEFDQFMKHKLKAEFYMRYSDDFIILSEDMNWLKGVLFEIKDFLSAKLKLELHPDKVSIRTLSSGVDFLGWVNFPEHRVLRTSTKKRMFNNIEMTKGKNEVVQSYLGLLSHGNTEKLQGMVRDLSSVPFSTTIGE